MACWFTEVSLSSILFRIRLLGFYDGVLSLEMNSHSKVLARSVLFIVFEMHSYRAAEEVPGCFESLYPSRARFTRCGSVQSKRRVFGTIPW